MEGKRSRSAEVGSALRRWGEAKRSPDAVPWTRHDAVVVARRAARLEREVARPPEH